MKYLIDKNLIEKIKNKINYNYGTEECYDEDNKIWLNLGYLEEILDDLLYKIHELEEEVEDLQGARNELWEIEQQRNVASWKEFKNR